MAVDPWEPVRAKKRELEANHSRDSDDPRDFWDFIAEILVRLETLERIVNPSEEERNCE